MSHQFHFGPFVLDVERFELRRNGSPVHLERIPLDLLILLVREDGKLLSREEIISRLWGKGVFFDTDNSINTAVRKIRRALGEDPKNPQYLETVPGKGYRFKNSVALGSGNRAHHNPPIKPRLMLAVLPFENLSGDSEQEYFSDGLTEETIMRLGQLSPYRIGVIARTSSMVYKQTAKTVSQIGQELGVDYVLEGSVRRDRDRVRITAQLIRASDQIHVWAQNYDRLANSILDVHGEIGSAIARQVDVTLSPDEQKRLAVKAENAPEAYDHYLRGRYHYARLTHPELRKAISHLEKATGIDSAFPLAYSGLADTLMILPITSDVDPRQVFPQAKLAIANSLRLDPYLSEAHNSDATAKFWFDWDFNGALDAATRAVTLNPNYALAQLYRAHILSNIGIHEQALAAIREARLLDPLSLITNTMYGQFLYHAGRDEDSAHQLTATVDMEPRFWVAQICLAKTLIRMGAIEQAVLACDRAWQFSGGTTEALSICAFANAVSGNAAEALSKLHQLLEMRDQKYIPAYNIALVYSGLRDKENTLRWLTTALEERDVHLPFLRDYKWEWLRDDAAFRTITASAGFIHSESIPA